MMSIVVVANDIFNVISKVSGIRQRSKTSSIWKP